MFTGSGVAIITPFTDDLKIDFDKLGELVEFHIENGTDALVVCGTTGEASTLNDDEHLSVIKFVVEKAAGRIHIMAGTGSNDTRHGIALSQGAEKLGVDSLLCVTPYYNKGNDMGLIKHYEAIADSVNIPIVLYNVPGRTGVCLKPDVVEQLSKHPNIKGIKEASGNISYVAELCRRFASEDFFIYSGNDDMIVPLLSLGGKGVISVVANILPKETHDLCQLFLDGKVEESRKIQLDLKPFIDSLFIEVNPIPIKKAMNLAGYKVGGYRLPLYEMSEDAAKILKAEMEKLNLLKG